MNLQRRSYLDNTITIQVCGGHDIINKRICILKGMVDPSESFFEGFAIELSSILDVETLEKSMYALIALGS